MSRCPLGKIVNSLTALIAEKIEFSKAVVAGQAFFVDTVEPKEKLFGADAAYVPLKLLQPAKPVYPFFCFIKIKSQWCWNIYVHVYHFSL